VAIVIRKKFKKNIKHWEEIDERIMKLEIEIWGHSIVIIAAYGPTEDTNVTIKDDFESKLASLLDNIGNRKEILLMGDLNARTGTEQEDNVIGKFGENVVNENGLRLIELCHRFDLRVMNGYFQHRDIHKYTWIQPTRKLKSIIDYIIQKQKSKLEIKDVRAMRGAECGTDHILLRGKVYLKFKKQNGKEDNDFSENLKEKNYKLELLQQDSIQFLYKMRITAKLTEEIRGNAEDRYNRMKEVIHEAAYEALGEQEGGEKTKYWWNKDIENLIKEKRKLYHIWLTTQEPEDRKQYARANREVKRAVVKAKNDAWNKRCSEVESYIGGTRSQEAWKTIKNMKQNCQNRTNIQLIRMEDWKNHYQKMLNEDRKEFQTTQINQRNQQKKLQEKEIIASITKKEVYEALRHMKNGKSAGPGSIPIELIKKAPECLVEILVELFNRCLIAGDKMPRNGN